MAFYKRVKVDSVVEIIFFVLSCTSFLSLLRHASTVKRAYNSQSCEKLRITSRSLYICVYEKEEAEKKNFFFIVLLHHRTQQYKHCIQYASSYILSELILLYGAYILYRGTNRIKRIHPEAYTRFSLLFSLCLFSFRALYPFLNGWAQLSG